MRILGIETSCDETAVAIVEDGKKLVSSVISSSSSLHEATGGIVPEIAAREQLRCITTVLRKALKTSTNHALLSGFVDIDAIAVTVGPGLIGSLLVGVETAKTISLLSQKPLIPVNHVLAHVYANMISDTTSQAISFPAVALVASGGHTEFFFMHDISHMKWLGGTIDDAAGEAFDKTARMIGLGNGGGAALSHLASTWNGSRPSWGKKLPRPMMHSHDLHMSFSGFKTAVKREIDTLTKAGHWNDDAKAYMAYEIQEAISEVLMHKTIQAADLHSAKTILLGGGVASNRRLSEKFRSACAEKDIGLMVPPPNLCTDNAAVIASYAYFHPHPVDWRDVEADPGLSVEVE